MSKPKDSNRSLPLGPVWRKSTRSGPAGECVEARLTGRMVEVRDSKNPDGPTLSFAPGAWADFTHAVAHDGLRAT